MRRSLSRWALTGMLLVMSIADATAQSSGGTLQPVQSTLTQLVSALTGPIARGDWATVEAHKEAIRAKRPELEHLYDTLAGATVLLA